MAIDQYCPWIAGSAALLTKHLKRITQEELDFATWRAQRIARKLKRKLRKVKLPDEWRGRHPMRAVPLGNALDTRLWREAKFTAAETKAKREEDRRNWRRSVDVSRCDFFVSHAWADEKEFPGAKVKMLRQHLCLQPLIAVLFVSSTLLTVFLLPFGLGISAATAAFPWWAPSAAVIAVAVAAFSWISLSLIGAVPATLTPWALSSQTLWLDKCCISQENDCTKAAGCSSFSRFLNRSDKVIAFVSPRYFSRLWCVYELASFCHLHNNELDKRLILFSLDWPSSMSPFFSSRLTKAERQLFEGFRCSNIQCAKPADRSFVMSEVRKNWGGEAEFETFVREELPQVFENSKKAYGRQLRRTAIAAFEMMFGA
mmetsp:Transcript_45738/g.99563  ORF Transcript_45738/g.99563 Transcript_45738/m.99563 type:complete len:371 (-) Transcript_45738:500-1612(-)